MLKPDLVDGLMGRMRDHADRRSQVHVRSNEILSTSKRSIFAVHRGDETLAEQELNKARAAIADVGILIQQEPRLAHEGAWRAAQEEFAEASLVVQYVNGRQIGRVPEIADDADIFLGALSDLTGELTRRAVLQASEGKFEEVHHIFDDVREAVDFLLQMDLTGQLRTKVDQAKQNLRKLEEIRYDISMRERL